MKTKVFFFMILFVTTVCAVNAQDKEVLGAWKLVNEKITADGNTQIKLITASNSTWILYGQDGKLLNGGASTYIVEDGKFIETITAHGNPLFKGLKAIYTYKIEGKKMTLNGYLEKDGVKLMENNEVWEKID